MNATGENLTGTYLLVVPYNLADAGGVNRVVISLTREIESLRQPS
jgi:hypothetical protein